MRWLLLSRCATLWSLAFVGVMGLATGCADSTLDSRLDSVEPTEISSFGDSELILTGTFLSRKVVSARTGDVEEYTDFSVFLEQVLDAKGNPVHDAPYIRQSRVEYQDPFMLKAYSESGLAGGTYAVHVEDPRGRFAVSGNDIQITVVEGKPDHAVFSADTTQFLLTNEHLILHIAVLDENGAWYRYPLKDRVTISVHSPGIEIDEAIGLDDPTGPYSDGDGVAVSGRLDEYSEGSITIRCADSTTCIDLEPFDVEVLSPSSWVGSSTVVTVDVQVVEPYSVLEVTLDKKDDASAIARVRDQGVGSGFEVDAGETFTVSVEAINSLDERASVDGEILLFDQNLDAIEIASEAGASSDGCIVASQLRLVEGWWEGDVTCFTKTEDARILVVGPLERYGHSEYFAVNAAEEEKLEVELEAEPFLDGGVMAGQYFSLRLRAVDAYENQVDFEVVTDVFLVDQISVVECLGWWLEGGAVRVEGCQILATHDSDTIVATIDQRLSGTSVPFSVFPAVADRLELDWSFSEVIAGDSKPVTLWVVDQYGNPTGRGSGPANVVDAPESEGGPELGEGLAVALIDGVGLFDLTLTDAVEKTSLEATFEGLAGNTGVFSVIAGQASAFMVSVPPGTIVAGDEQTASIEIVDGFGNLISSYTGSKSLELSAINTELYGSGSRTVDFESGRADLGFRPTKADDEAYLRVDDGAGLAGTSNRFQVEARPDVDHFEIIDPDGVHFKGVVFSATIQAQDEYGNVVTEYTSGVNAADRNGDMRVLTTDQSEAWNVGPFVDGQYIGTFVIDDVAVANRITVQDVEDSLLVGESELFPVYDLNCDPPPPPVTLTFVGHGEHVVACEGESISFRATSNIDGIYDYVWSFGDGEINRGVRADEVDHEYQSANHYQASVAVVDSSFCASQATGDVYVGVDDGSPTGPMTLVASGVDHVVAGADDGSQIAPMTLTASNCRKNSAVPTGQIDASSAFRVTVITSMGQLEERDASPDQGMQYELGLRTGEAVFNYTAANVLHAGTARVVAVYEQVVNGESRVLAHGVASIPVENDRQPPFVIDYFPRGRYFEDVREILVEFSEPIREDNLVIDSEGQQEESPQIAPVSVQLYSEVEKAYRWIELEDLELSAGGYLLTIKLAETIFLSDLPGQVEVTLASGRNMDVPSITDIAGNYLDGDWDGMMLLDKESGLWRDSFVFRFGNSDIPAPVGVEALCGVAPVIFSPDGQHGLEEESDWTVFTSDVTAYQGLRAYNVEVFDPMFPDEEVVLASLWYSIPDYAGTGSWELEWDGADLDGQILPNEEYEYNVNLVDPNDNWLSGICSGVVVVRNPVDLGAYP